MWHVLILTGRERRGPRLVVAGTQSIAIARPVASQHRERDKIYFTR
jgi:hypothetical protein